MRVRPPIARRRHRKGSVYIFVLASAMLVITTALSAIALNRSRLSRENMLKDAAMGSSDAQSGLEWATHLLESDPNGRSWRRSADYSVSLSSVVNSKSGTRTVLRFSDPVDADLRGDSGGAIRVLINATNGVAKQTLSFDMTPELTSMACLNYGLVVDGALTTPGGTIINSGTQYTGATYTLDDDLKLDVKATLDAMASNNSPPAPVDTFPVGVLMPTTELIDYWVSIGTMISRSDIPGAKLRRCVLSSTSNPFGATNPRGVYVIDCTSSNVDIESIRVEGTLVLLDPGVSSVFSQSNYFEAPPGQPALLIRGNMRFDTEATDLSEAAESTNYNPAGTPFLGSADSDTSDVYPSLVKGVVYVSGNAKFYQKTWVQGSVIIGGSCEVTDLLAIRHDPPDAPITGLSTVSGLAIVPGSLSHSE